MLHTSKEVIAQLTIGIVSFTPNLILCNTAFSDGLGPGSGSAGVVISLESLEELSNNPNQDISSTAAELSRALNTINDLRQRGYDLTPLWELLNNYYGSLQRANVVLTEPLPLNANSQARQFRQESEEELEILRESINDTQRELDTIQNGLEAIDELNSKVQERLKQNPAESEQLGSSLEKLQEIKEAVSLGRLDREQSDFLNNLAMEIKKDSGFVQKSALALIALGALLFIARKTYLERSRYKLTSKNVQEE